MTRYTSLLVLVLMAGAAAAAEGLVSLKSPHRVKDTMDRFESAAKARGQVWLGYNDPRFLARRHGAGECAPVVQDLAKALSGLAQEAVR